MVLNFVLIGRLDIPGMALQLLLPLCSEILRYAGAAQERKEGRRTPAIRSHVENQYVNIFLQRLRAVEETAGRDVPLDAAHPFFSAARNAMIYTNIDQDNYDAVRRVLTPMFHRMVALMNPPLSDRKRRVSC